MGIAVGSPKKVKGNKLQVVNKPIGRVSSDEPADTLQGSANVDIQKQNSLPLAKQVQGGKYNPGATPLQNDSPVNYKQSPQGNNSAAVNATGGLVSAIKQKVFGKKKGK